MAQKVWMFTGASRGLGAEIASAVLVASDKVVATARNVTALDYLGANEKLQKLALAVTDESQGKKAVDAAVARFGVDVLVNNTGCGELHPIEQT